MSENDTWLVQQVEKSKKGDNVALERLIDRLYGDIFRMVYYRIFSRMDAEDITQDICRQMIKSIPKIKAPDKFKPWLYRLVNNRNPCPLGKVQ